MNIFERIITNNVLVTKVEFVYPYGMIKTNIEFSSIYGLAKACLKNNNYKETMKLIEDISMHYSEKDERKKANLVKQIEKTRANPSKRKKHRLVSKLESYQKYYGSQASKIIEKEFF